MTFISCVIPTHRRASLLGEALQSVVDQSRVPDEVIVVSDIEDPATRAVCESTQLPNGVLITYLEPDSQSRGASVSRNRGASAARGDLIAFLDDDDLWSEGYLERAEDAADGVDLVVTWFDEFGEGHSQSAPRIVPGLRGQDVASLNPGATGSNMIVTAAAFARIDGFDEGLPVKNDTDFLYRLLRGGASYAVVPEVLVYQRKHLSGQLTAKTAKRAHGTALYLEKHRASLTAEDIRTLRQQIERIRSHSADSRIKRLAHMLRMVSLYNRLELATVIRRRGRDRSHATVAAFSADLE